MAWLLVWAWATVSDIGGLGVAFGFVSIIVNIIDQPARQRNSSKRSNASWDKAVTPRAGRRRMKYPLTPLPPDQSQPEQAGEKHGERGGFGNRRGGRQRGRV